jgi:hypothetical protein
VAEDDDIIEAHEAEFTADEQPVRRSNRGFWLIAGTLLVACVLLIVEIFANRGIKDTVAHAQHSLRVTESAARALVDEQGSLAAADAGSLAGRSSSVRFTGPTTASDDLDAVSVAAGPEGWGAAVMARPGACFYLRIVGDTTGYGSGTVCTGERALELATDTRW